MRADDFTAQARRGAELADAGDYGQATRVFEDLVSSDIPATDKMVICLNLATVHARMNRPDEALAWLDRGIEHERRAGGFTAREHKAAFLAGLGRRAESRALYEALLAAPGLAEPDRRRLRHNRDVLQSGVHDGAPGAPGALVVIRGDGRWLVGAGALMLLLAGLLWLAAAAGVAVPREDPIIVYSALGLWTLIGLAALGAGLGQGRERYELTADRLRHTGLWRTRDIPVAEVSDVTWETIFAVVPGALGVLPLPSIVIRSRRTPPLRMGLLPIPSQRHDVGRLVQGLVRANPAIRLDSAVREFCGLEAG